VRIVDLARDLIELSGLQVGHDIDIVFTGTRPGEKLFEELFAKGEKYARTRHEKIYIVANASSLVPPRLPEAIGELQALAENSNSQGIEAHLRRIVPQYRPERAGQPGAQSTDISSNHADALHSGRATRSAQGPDSALPSLQPEDSGIAQV
jgi:FlaA1/EpsC-like NDP-sugar epimerase